MYVKSPEETLGIFLYLQYNFKDNVEFSLNKKEGYFYI